MRAARPLLLLVALQQRLDGAHAQAVCTAPVCSQHWVDGNCTCAETNDGKLYVAFMGDTSAEAVGYSAQLAKHFTVAKNLINDHSDGFYDAVLNDGTVMETTLAHSGCAADLAAPAYWDLRTNWGKPLHGIVGNRCSGASMAVARIAGLEHIPQISMSATSSKLSNNIAYPFFYRTAAPDDADGEVGALVAMLSHFGWERVSILNTDTAYTSGAALEFNELFLASGGAVAKKATISLGDDGAIDKDSVVSALESIPTDHTGSRIILLIAHSQDAWSILETAALENFQPDTVWVGTGSWTTEMPPDDGWMPTVPGYIGLVPYVNTGPKATDYLGKLQAYETSIGEPTSNTISKFGPETVDAVIAMAMVMSALPHSQRRNGAAITAELQSLSFEGVSGTVEFTAKGNRKDPKYSLFSMNTKSGWTKIGTVGLTAAEVAIESSLICWAELGCGVEAPDDAYPEAVKWGWIIGMSVLGLAFFCLVGKYLASKHSKQKSLKAAAAEVRMQKTLKAAAAEVHAAEVRRLEQETEDLKKGMKGMYTITKALASNQIQKQFSNEESLERTLSGGGAAPPAWNGEMSNIEVNIEGESFNFTSKTQSFPLL